MHPEILEGYAAGNLVAVTVSEQERADGELAAEETAVLAFLGRRVSPASAAA